MQTINVIQDFVLSLENGTKRSFKVGIHEVEDHIANHWYTKAHTKPVAESPAAASQPVPPPSDDNNTTATAAASANSSGDAAPASAAPAAEAPPPTTGKKK